jgi:hypothetical protein
MDEGTGPEEITTVRQLALLFLMGLFDRSMEKGDRGALLAEPVIPGLTDGLVGLTPGQIDYAVQSQRDLGLLLPKDEGAPGDLDAHPLVREYFGARLEKVRPDAWCAAQGRLYDYYRFRGPPEAFRSDEAYGVLAYKASFPEGDLAERVDGVLTGRRTIENSPNLPPSFFTANGDRLRAAVNLVGGPEWKEALSVFLPASEEAMAPLFAAIAHGCAAGRGEETFNEVYWPRIIRGNEKFATQKLGLYGSNLAALAHFFAEPFAVPAPALSPGTRAIALSEAGFALRALGRLAEAVEPMRVGAELQAARAAWANASIGHSNLSELLVMLGRLGDDAAKGEAGAVAVAAQSVAYGDQSGDPFERMSRRASHANALMQVGAWAESDRRFAEAEAFERNMNPDLPLGRCAATSFAIFDLARAVPRRWQPAARMP